MEIQDVPNHAATLLSKSNQPERIKSRNGKFFFQKRYLVALLAFLGWTFLILMRTNLSISIVDMTSNRSVTIGNETVIKMPDFDWSSQTKAVLLSAFSWGYMSAPLGALVVNRYGGVSTFGAGILLTALLTTLSPILIGWNLYAYLVARILEGIFEGASAASFLEAMRLWSVPRERNRFIGGSVSGYIFGTVLGYPICGTIAYHLNWQLVFYITGGATLVWSIIWFTFVRNNPEEDDMMSVEEKQYLKQFNNYNCRLNVSYPWSEIFKSKPVWAYWNDRFVAAWSESFLTYSLPLYIKDVHDINIQDIGFLSGMPHICAAISLIGGSILADFLRNRELLSVSNVHRLYLSFAQFAAILLLVLVAWSENFITSIICFCLFRLFFSISSVSYEVLPVDMGGPFCSVIVGFGFAAVACGIALSPLVMGFIVTHHSAGEWTIYFLVLSCFNLWGGLIFFKFGSGKLQPWALRPNRIGNTEL